VGEGATDPIHFGQALVEIETIPHEEAMEGEAANRLGNDLIHVASAAGEHVDEHLRAVEARVGLLVHIDEIALVVFFLSRLASEVLEEQAELLKRAPRNISGDGRQLPLVEQPVSDLDPVLLVGFQAAHGSLVVLQELPSVVGSAVDVLVELLAED